MKLIRTEKQIISLENVMEIEKTVHEHYHTTRGIKSAYYDTNIFIHYFGGDASSILIEDEKDPTCPKSNEMFEKIFEILEK